MVPVVAALALATLAGCKKEDEPKARNVIFFLGDGMGIAPMTAARVYAVGEDGELTMDTLPETAFVKTYSNDAQVTDSAPSMSAYMTGVKTNNEVLSMSPDTEAVTPGANSTNLCGSGNGQPVETLLELAEKHGRVTGIVSTARITHATPAATYAHICHRDLENDIAAQLVPAKRHYNRKLGDGIEVIFGGGARHFLPASAGGSRTDGVDLTAQLKAEGYVDVSKRAAFDSLNGSNTQKAFGLFTKSHMSYDLDRDPAKEPSLAEMTSKAIQILQQKRSGFFLMVEGGRIDHALHETNAKRALQDTVAFDNAIKAAIAEVRKTDPKLKNTLIVVTADHDHTMTMLGYAARTGKTTANNAGVLGVMRNYSDGSIATDADGMPFPILAFGNGENRPQGARSNFAPLTDAETSANNFHQEAAIRTAVGSETHGGTDVWLGALGYGADAFHGVIDNTEVFSLVRKAADL
ncbi:alkaline phosphatase [Permianibacter sp. IMCC34836]|nr:alkaline phosphatase [Permianibacter fluminis]